MDRKTLIWVGVIVLIALGYYLISPLWKVKKLNEGLPEVATSTISGVDEKVLESMTEENKNAFEAKMAEMKDVVISKKEGMPDFGSYEVVKKANMTPSAHAVSGEAQILKFGEQYYLRLENLKTVNGPDLRVYLSSSLDNKDIINLGPIRATEGSANYVIPLGSDITKYKNVLIWCKPFGVLFSYAELN